ncbi:MAG: iron-sulfur cluster assembly accessory protein [Alphaproteobacteria bacterium]|jgi:iron-sulfur cluster assembly protein|nr:iron-sulfur cluster assembly accessory protein [Alphaproteobacteria bacterium]
MAGSSLKLMSLTDAAAARIRFIMENADKPIAAIRVGVKNGGCAGMAYTIDYAESLAAHEDVVEDKGVKVVIDPKALMFLVGTEMDYKTDKFTSQFVFNNPNETSACGCGESVAIKPVDPAALVSAEH